MGPAGVVDPAIDDTIMSATGATAADVRAAQAACRARSEAVRAQLVARLSTAGTTLATAQAQLAAHQPAALVVRDEADVLSQRLAQTARTAERVSARIRALDEEQRRLALATDWARQAAELKAALVALNTAIDQADWDAAVLHVQTAMAVPEPVLNSRFAASVVPTAELPDAPPATLLALRERLKQIFERAYRAATASKDAAVATKFFKLFPQVGWRNEGLTVYAESACDLVRDIAVGLNGGLASAAAQGQAFVFSTLLTRLFEHMALLVDRHEILVNKYYGAESFGKGVMPHLQAECDRLGCRIFDTWLETRDSNRLLEQAKSLSSTSLRLQLTPSRAPSPMPLPLARASTPAPEVDTDADSQLRREADQFLAEAAAISAAWTTYKSFLYDRLGTDFVPETNPPKPVTGSGPDIVRASKLGQQVRSFLRGPYLQLEGVHLRRSLTRAWNLAVSDPHARPMTSSFMDDSFYVIRAALSRALSTSDVPAAHAACTAAAQILLDGVLSRVRDKLDAVARGSVPMMAVEGPRKETATRELRTAFVIWLNGLHAAVLYSDRMRHDLTEPEFLAQYYDTELDPDRDESPEDGAVSRTQVEQVRKAVEGAFERPQAQLRATLSSELERLFNTLTRPRVRTLLTDAYKDVSYVLDDAGYALAEEKDVVRRRFSAAWDRLWSVFKDTFEPVNFDAYHGLAIEALVRPWEKLVLSMRFTGLGALRFDHDLRAVSAHVSHTAMGRTKGMGAREQFIRLQQMSYLLTLDPDEDEESAYETAAASGMSWRLSSSEVKHTRSLRLP